jgi:PKD repeat protein
MKTNQRYLLIILATLFSSTYLSAQIPQDHNLINSIDRTSLTHDDLVGRAENMSNDTNFVYWGYYLLQGVSTYNRSAWGSISTVSEADSIAHVLKEHTVSGVEYGTAYYHPHDISTCVTIANVFKNSSIDLWLTSAALQKCMPAFNNDTFPSNFRACSMTPDGLIVPASVYSLSTSEKVPAFDVMNPAAMNWFIDRYKQIFLDPLSEYTSGYFFNEDCLYYANDPGHPNNRRIDYWELPAYSDAVLEEWRRYCIEHSVTFNGEAVTQFPVHSSTMASNGEGKTKYFPGYSVPYEIDSGTALISIPRNTGVWAAWDDFVTSQYVETWIGGISKAVWDVNRHNPGFKGVIYFALHDWSLAYEEVVDPSFVVDSFQKWVPWGTQRGVRLDKICALSSIDHVICETFPPIHSNLYSFIATYKEIITDHGKTFGLMVHRDDNWGLDGWDTESDRWEAIYFFQPAIVARYPVNRIFPADQYYDAVKENLFDVRMREYRLSAVSADFSASPTSGPPPLTVQFTDQSTGDVTSRLWNFGDGATSIESNPSHTYHAPGMYTVKLTVTGPGGPDTKNRTDYISVALDSDNMLLNGNFSDGTNHWVLYCAPSATASGSVQNGEYVVSITNGGSNTYDCQLFQTNLSIENGATYDVSFEAYAAASRQILPYVAMRSSPWTTYGGYQAVTLSTAKQTYNYSFTMNHATDPDARIVFDLGNSNTDVYFDNMILTKRKPSNMVFNGEFSHGVCGWDFFVFSPAEASCSVRNGEYVMSIANGGSNGWDVHAQQSPLLIENGSTYHFSFDAYAASTRQIIAFVAMSEDPWTIYGYQELMVSTAKQNYSYSFTMNHATNPDARLVFDVGVSDIDVYLDNIVLTKETAVVDDPENIFHAPERYILYQNYPNPFNSGTEIRYTLPEKRDVILTVRNVQGRTIRHLVKSVKSSGTYSVTWDGNDEFDTQVPSGVYFLVIQAGDFTQIRKALLIR